MIIVADSSPLIALARVGRLELWRSVFGSVLLPMAVWAELVQVGMDRPGWAAVVTADWIGRRYRLGGWRCLVMNRSRFLTRFGRGFSRFDLGRFRAFFLAIPTKQNRATPSLESGPSVVPPASAKQALDVGSMVEGRSSGSDGRRT